MLDIHSFIFSVTCPEYPKYNRHCSGYSNGQSEQNPCLCKACILVRGQRKKEMKDYNTCYVPSLLAQKVESACHVGDLGSMPGLGRSPGEGIGYPLQYPCLENSMDRGAWWARSRKESDMTEQPTLSFSLFHDDKGFREKQEERGVGSAGWGGLNSAISDHLAKKMTFVLGLSGGEGATPTVFWVNSIPSRLFPMCPLVPYLHTWLIQ